MAEGEKVSCLFSVDWSEAISSPRNSILIPPTKAHLKRELRKLQKKNGGVITNLPAGILYEFETTKADIGSHKLSLAATQKTLAIIGIKATIEEKQKRDQNVKRTGT